MRAEEEEDLDALQADSDSEAEEGNDEDILQQLAARKNSHAEASTAPTLALRLVAASEALLASSTLKSYASAYKQFAASTLCTGCSCMQHAPCSEACLPCMQLVAAQPVCQPCMQHNFLACMDLHL